MLKRKRSVGESFSSFEQVREGMVSGFVWYLLLFCAPGGGGSGGGEWRGHSSPRGSFSEGVRLFPVFSSSSIVSSRTKLNHARSN